MPERKDSCQKAHYAVFRSDVDSYNEPIIKRQVKRKLERQVFLGKYARNLDERNRISVPPSFRRELSGGAYMTQGFDRNLQVLPVNAFQQVYRQAAALNIADPSARLLLRLFLGNAVELAPSKGWIQVPDNLREFADLQENVLLIGQGEYFEIWAPEFWNQQEAQMKDAEANAARFSTLSIATRPGTAS